MNYLIVGLGNPGPEYAMTRHNIGFMAADFLARGLQVKSWGSEHKALLAKVKTTHNQIYIAKPQTFMNRSGESVQSILNYYKIPLDNLLVIHDELDLPFQSMRFQKNRGAGGNNGIKSIHEQLGTSDYSRLKLGIGRPEHPGHDISDWVLSSFSKNQESDLAAFLNKAQDAVIAWVEKGLARASNEFNC